MPTKLQEDVTLATTEVPTEVVATETPKTTAPKKETKALFSTWEKAVQEELLMAKPLIERGNVQVVIHVDRHTPNAKEIHVPSLAVAVREMK